MEVNGNLLVPPTLRNTSTGRISFVGMCVEIMGADEDIVQHVDTTDVSVPRTHHDLIQIRVAGVWVEGAVEVRE
jgi:hypothetical protein